MLRNLILFISALTAAFASMNAQTTDSYAKPDFAFPTKVAENARAMLSRGLNENDGSLTLRALMNLSIALTDIDTDSATTVIADCRRASSSLKSDADRALVDLLTARIYAALYQQNRWNYDRREQPATESSDYKLWNGNQWRDTIMTLVDRAMSPVGTLAATPCASYSKVLSIDASIEVIYKDSVTSCIMQVASYTMQHAPFRRNFQHGKGRGIDYRILGRSIRGPI